jgi:hypothetical protein
MFALVAQSSLAGDYIQGPISTKFLSVDNLHPIHSIALLVPPEPPNYYLGERRILANYDELPFWLSMLSASGDRARRRRNTNAYGDFSFAKVMQDSLKQYLEMNDYQVVEVAVYKRELYRLLQNYDYLSVNGVDAYLDIAPIEIGYKQSVSNDSPSGPIVSVVVRLVSADTKKVIFAETISYGWAPGSALLHVDFKSPIEHQFINLVSLRKNEEKAFDHLKEGIEKVAFEIARYFWTESKALLQQESNPDGSSSGFESSIPQVGISGIYSSEVKGKPSKYTRLKIVQIGNNITGTFGVGSVINADGIYESDTIKLYWGEIEACDGKLKVSTSYQLVGSWSCGAKGGKWRLRKLSSAPFQRVKDIDDESEILIVKNEEASEQAAIEQAAIEQAAIEQAISGTDITGTYASKMTGKTLNRNRRITLSQSGNIVTGSWGNNPGNIFTGTREGDIIVYNLIEYGRPYEKVGKWRIMDSGRRIEGSWSRSDGKHGGKWNLTKIE